jgi:hypothetical protein
MKDSRKDGLKGELNADEFAAMREKLRDAVPPIDELKNDAELGRDLWPDMLRRMEQPRLRVPWFDWALLAFTGAVLVFFPALIPALLYQL